MNPMKANKAKKNRVAEDSQANTYLTDSYVEMYMTKKYREWRVKNGWWARRGESRQLTNKSFVEAKAKLKFGF